MRGDLSPTGDVCHIRRHFWLSQWEGVLRHLWVEVRDTATHPTVHRTTPSPHTPQNFVAQNVNSASTEKPWPSLTWPVQHANGPWHSVRWKLADLFWSPLQHFQTVCLCGSSCAHTYLETLLLIVARGIFLNNIKQITSLPCPNLQGLQSHSQ